jgi:hypothetical protein
MLLAGATAASAIGVSGSQVWKVEALAPTAHTISSFSEPGIAAGPDGLLIENACTSNSGAGLASQPKFTTVRLSGTTPVHVGAVDNMGAIGFDIGQDWALRDFQSLTVDRCGHPHVTWAGDYKSTRTYVATTTPYC